MQAGGTIMKLETNVVVRRVSITAFAALACAALGGCMTSSPIWEAHFGEAVRSNARVQIIDAHAGDQAPSPQGIDGKAAASVMDLYDKSYAHPPVSSNAYTMGVSNGGGGGSGGGQ